MKMLRRGQPNSLVSGRMSARQWPFAANIFSGTFWIMSASISSARPMPWKLRRHSSSMPTARG